MKRIWPELPIADPLERRQAPLLLMLLPLMFVTSFLRSVFFFQLDRATNGTALTVAISVIALGSPAIGLLLLFRGRFSAAALLAALSMLLAVVLAISASGLRHSGMLPLVFALPIVLTGLLLGWRSLLFVCTLSCTAVIGIAILESQRSPLVASTPSPEIPASMASIFIVVVIMLLSILAWFRRDFRHELASRLHTEQSLRQSEARFATAFRASPAAMLISRLSDGSFIDVNASYERLFGYRRDELIGQVETTLNIYTHPEQRAEIIQLLGQHGSLRDHELVLRAKSGELRTVLCSVEILALDGEACALGNLVDVTERKKIERGMQQATERLHILADASRVFAESGSNYQALLDTITQNVVEKLGDFGVIRLLSEDGQWLPIAAMQYWDPADQEAQSFLHTMALQEPPRADEPNINQQVFQTGTPLLVPVVDLAAMKAASKPEYLPVIERFGLRSMLIVPLRRQNRSIGILGVYRIRPQWAAFTEDDLRLAQDLADRAALAISNAQLLQQVQAELAERQRVQRVTELLYEASQLLARPLDQDAILETILDVLQQLIPYDSANIMLPDSSNMLRVRYMRGYEAWTTPAVVKGLIFDPQQPSPIGRIMATQRSLLIADTRQEPTWDTMAGTMHVGCWLGVPLIANNMLIGIYSLDRQEPHSFTERDMRIAEMLAVSAATAIERAHLIAQLHDERAQLAHRVEERTADLSVANAELARAARLKDEFLASMSHELRTPLNSILGRSQALQEEIYGALTPRQIEVLRGLEESGRHLLSLINDILDLSKIEAGKLNLEVAPLNVDALCRMSMRMVAQAALKKRISLTATVDTLVGTMLADERRLKQILVNLLSNAVKFTPDGGKVGLEVQADRAGQTVIFTVWDTGIGIAAEDLPKLFKPFVQIDGRLSRQYEGTGLGLALVRRLAEAHGGSVALESTPGQGSRFSVALPWQPAEISPAPAPGVAASNSSVPAIHQVLVIEDSPTSAERIARFLSEIGASVEINTHGRGVIEQAISAQPDLIMLDVMLPDLAGWEVLQQLKAEPRTQHIPVLIASVVDDPERARTLGAAAFLLKPIERETLRQTLRQVLSDRAASPMQTAPVIAPPAVRTRILLAEDNESNIELLEYYLQAKGYEVVVARNGGEALDRAHESPPHAILMDIQMPGMDGLEAIRRIRADAGLRAIPIIAVTALAMPGDRERCMAAGADDYLTKPINLSRLLETIESLRQRREKLPDDGLAEGSSS